MRCPEGADINNRGCNPRTAELQSGRTAEQQNRRTAGLFTSLYAKTNTT